MATAYDEKLVDGKALDQLAVGMYEKLKTKINEKSNTTVMGGSGLTVSKSGDEYTVNLASSSDGITVNEDNITLNTIDAFNSDSTTKPLSAKKGKELKTLVDGKASQEHNHQVGDITGLPTALKNPYSLDIKLNGVSQGEYDGSTQKTVNITAQTIGALPTTGNATINGNFTVTGDFLSNGDVTAFSDVRAKRDIKELKCQKELIEKLKQVKFYNFRLIDDKNDKVRVGVLAQELEEIFPELVIVRDNGLKTVNYIELNLYFSLAMQSILKGDL